MYNEQDVEDLYANFDKVKVVLKYCMPILRLCIVKNGGNEMKDSQKELDFLQEVAKRISERTKQNSSISPEDVFDLLKDTLEETTTDSIIEMPIFMPVIIEKEDDFFTARSYGYRICKGFGRNEEDAVEKLKEEINAYNQSCINSEKKLKIEEMVNNIFPKNRL
ncbi:hypothetical protein D1B32_11380 [Oceanobacillus profundus]|uniref:Uncharacterized protein n=2 Tax=Oceanobacillus profundus TaxID=372463 RepID=A0A417YHI1_9BACI|nr:hypothetical protein D1B32_11380 [Oceanobacillus profundus]